MRPSVILGVSADLHDAAAALVIDGEIVAAAQEERFTRRKHEPSLPLNAIAWCLEFAGVGPGELDRVAFHDKPLTTYERILVTHARSGPRGFRSLAQAIASWSTSKLWVAARLDRALRELGHRDIPLAYAEHHQSHAAAAFYPSPFDHAAILTFDGVGEWATSSIGRGSGNRIEISHQLEFPDSVGLLYSTITAHCGFAVNDGEYKLMGLAPYGEPRFAEVLRDRVVRISEDGSIRLNQDYFGFQSGHRMGSRRLDRLLDGPPRSPGAPITEREADLAASIQVVLEEILLAMAAYAHRVTGESRACLAGGVALNCVANARLLTDGPFKEIWIQPAAGDDGSAIGAALWVHHQLDDEPRGAVAGDAMSGCQLGPAFAHTEIAAWLRDEGVEFEEHPDLAELCSHVARQIDSGQVVGWFRGRMEFGPRALGNRSILADPRRVSMVPRINAAVKQREGFRPFAPAVLAERAHEWFDVDRALPYMLVTTTVREEHRLVSETRPGDSFADRLAVERSTIPACTHVDHSARVQTVAADVHPDFHRLIAAFAELTDCPVLLNTSFNGPDEPIVRTPADAFRCFVAGDLDLLVLEGCVIRRPAVASFPGGRTC